MGQSTTDAVSSRLSRQARLRRLAYPIALLVVYAGWVLTMGLGGWWHLFGEHWPVSLTMSLGSFVAGATAEGGAAIAFPVFTKALAIEPAIARTFGLMIQSVGMTMAGLVIVVRRVPFLPRVVLWASIGGVLGQVLGTFFLDLSGPYAKILFTLVATVFGITLAISRWALKWEPLPALPHWNDWRRTMFLAVGVAGGIVAANTGSGIDILTFIVLTLAIGVDEKVSTPTTVIIMAINSVVGTFLRVAVVQDVGIAFEYWLVAVPIVVIGAPLGAIVASRATRDQIIGLLLTLITIELITTIWLVPFTDEAKIVTAIATVATSAWFWSMLHYRHRRAPEPQPAESGASP